MSDLKYLFRHRKCSHNSLMCYIAGMFLCRSFGPVSTRLVPFASIRLARTMSALLYNVWIMLPNSLTVTLQFCSINSKFSWILKVFAKGRKAVSYSKYWIRSVIKKTSFNDLFILRKLDIMTNTEPNVFVCYTLLPLGKHCTRITLHFCYCEQSLCNNNTIEKWVLKTQAHRVNEIINLKLNMN